MHKIITFIALITVSQLASAVTISMDFEDGLLPSSHGWENIPLESAGTSHSIIPGAAPGIGGNSVLHITGSDHFGWVFDLGGIVSLNEDWLFSVDVQRVSGGGGLNDIAISRIADGNGGAAHIGSVTDTDWHNLTLELIQSDGVVNSYLDGILQSAALPLDNSNGQYSNAIQFLFSNVGVAKTVNFDNVFFSSSISSVPEPSTLLLLLLGLTSLSFSSYKRQIKG